MKKIFVLFAAMATALTSCNLVEDMFDWSNDKEDKEFSSDTWTSAQRNVVTVELSDWGSETVTLPETGEVSILPDYDKGTASLLFKSFKLVDPTEKPEGSDTYWLRKALYVCLCVNDVPFKVSDDGKIQFSKKTVSGTLTYGDMSGDTVDLSDKQKDCKVSISGGMTQAGAKGSFLTQIPMTGDLSVKIITPDGEHLLFGFTKLDTSSTDEGFLNIFR